MSSIRIKTTRRNTNCIFLPTSRCSPLLTSLQSLPSFRCSVGQYLPYLGSAHRLCPQPTPKSQLKYGFLKGVFLHHYRGSQAGEAPSWYTITAPQDMFPFSNKTTTCTLCSLKSVSSTSLHISEIRLHTALTSFADHACPE